MAKKEIIRVPFNEERLKTALEFSGQSMNSLAIASGVSLTTIKRAVKSGTINRVHAAKIADNLLVTVAFLSGDKSLNAVAKAFHTVAQFQETAPDMLREEIAAMDVE